MEYPSRATPRTTGRPSSASRLGWGGSRRGLEQANTNGSHGLSDTVVPIADGRAGRDKILQQNHCGTTTTPVDPSPCVAYQGCDDGYPVTWCEWDGPHGIPSFGSSAIAAFFKQF